MKKQKLITLGIVILIALVLILITNLDNKNYLDINNEGITTINQETLIAELNTGSSTYLTSGEKEGLLLMREEEKLARDVYQELYDTWGIKSFSNIGNAEQTHMNSVGGLVELYGLEDPASNSEGEFNNQELQDLYNQLVREGTQSELDALKVGAAVEEIDILDLERLMEETDNGNILLVYENLLKGSRNHLRAFVKQIELRGEEYSPQYLDIERYLSIVNTEIERGRA